jgi:hypothetical protein
MSKSTASCKSVTGAEVRRLSRVVVFQSNYGELIRQGKEAILRTQMSTEIFTSLLLLFQRIDEDIVWFLLALLRDLTCDTAQPFGLVPLTFLETSGEDLSSSDPKNREKIWVNS